jgi:hypothetical protein
MNRRDLLQAALPATATAVLAASTGAVTSANPIQEMLARELYEWRTYRLTDQSSQAALHEYLKSACIPAWQRMGLGPVGAFTEIGAGAGPSIHVLLVYPTADVHAAARIGLEQDAQYKRAAAEYLAAKKDAPRFDRIESWLMLAFANYPVITEPARKPRVLELRTYENHGEERARAKIDMFNDGEIEIFPQCGFENVFFGECLIGSGLPCLKYMLAAPSMEANAAGWKTFISHPDFVKMRDDPKYANTEPKITKLFLEPTAYSQV